MLDEIATVRSQVAALLAGGTPLPVEPDWEAVSKWSISAHRRHCGWV